tara:strand:+ start:397 stop:585 length:189 start_codon:yes stop_codon:yes gene_type:complete
MEKIMYRELSDNSKIVNILGYFWSLPKEDQEQVFKILEDAMKESRREKNESQLKHEEKVFGS